MLGDREPIANPDVSIKFVLIVGHIRTHYYNLEIALALLKSLDMSND